MRTFRFFEICALGILLTNFSAQAQILPSGATVVQGSEVPNRGYPVSVLAVDASGNPVSASGTPTGTAGSPNAAVVTVQGITNGTPQPQVGNVASGATDVGNPVKIGGIYLTSPTAVTTGQRTDLVLSARGRIVPELTQFGLIDAQSNANVGSFPAAGLTAVPLWVVGSVYNGTTWDRQRGDTTGTYVVEVPSASTNAGVAISATTVAAGSLVVKASSGNLYGYNVTAGASAGYVLIFNAISAPADGVVTPARCIPLAANAGIDVDLRGQPTFFSTGITIVFSTTGCFTKTISATAFIAADAK